MTKPAAARGLSPCVNICRMDAGSGWCAGCLRTLDEIAAWGQLDEAAQRALLAQLPARRVQWRRLRAAASAAPATEPRP
ncbi:MAG: DUF1289 domain-containing protein [Burkholderiales bacterium]|nr:DUF1289 domain-containing protein [Burkholderiales bacterium]